MLREWEGWEVGDVGGEGAGLMKMREPAEMQYHRSHNVTLPSSVQHLPRVKGLSL